VTPLLLAFVRCRAEGERERAEGARARKEVEEVKGRLRR